tara:strand:- start:968 stop:1168 length:201 start_codon:yes stop_codon:yes gene_type:complete
MAGYPEYYKISYITGERVLTVCDNPKTIPVLSPKKRKTKPQKAKSLHRAAKLSQAERHEAKKRRSK